MKKTKKKVSKKAVVAKKAKKAVRKILELEPLDMENAEGPLVEGSFIIVKLYDHNNVYQDHDIVQESGDRICIGCKDASGEYLQFDSCEAYHSPKWATDRGFRVEIEHRKIEFKV